MRAVVVTPPAPVVSFEEAARHLKFGSDQSEKTYVEALIAAATAHIDGPDGWLNRSLGPQTLEARFDATLAGGDVRLPCGPVISLLDVRYVGQDGVLAQANVSDFELLGAQLVPAAMAFPWEASWSLRREAVRIQYRAGYEAGIPAPIKASILMMVADLYENRTTVETGLRAAAVTIPMSTTVEALLAPYRVWS